MKYKTLASRPPPPQESHKGRKRRLPDWLKVPLPGGVHYNRLKSLVQKHGLHTVCQSASCPNMGACWDAGTLTLMILGEVCTRACRFCDVATGRPLAPRWDEPEEVGAMLSRLRLRYVVVTSVDRDDLADGGASHWARVIRTVKEKCPHIKLEALIPDFRGEPSHIAEVCEAGPDLLAHNVETVPSLQAAVRPQCQYQWSLRTLEIAGSRHGLATKSGLMLGLGETKREVVQTMRDLVRVGCKILTLGQYLRPSLKHLEVVEFVTPEVFLEYKEIGEALGLRHVEAGPLVRSSYRADRQARSIGV